MNAIIIDKERGLNDNCFIGYLLIRRLHMKRRQQHLAIILHKLISLVACFITTLFLLSCDRAPSISEICETNTEICNTLKEDNWCKAERNKSISTFVNLSNKPKEENDYYLLLSYEAYEKCMKKASLIEHKKLKEKQNNRINNTLNVQQLISELSQATINSKHPLLLYYHWSRNLNKTALAQLLSIEGTKKLETAESQYNMATYYIKRDIDKTFNFLFHALELQQPNEVIDVNIFKSLTTLFLDQNNQKQAYIWLKILELYAPKEGVGKQVLEGYVTSYKLDKVFLDKVAVQTLDKITQGKFIKPKN